MDIVYRKDKEAPLSHEEMDNNFKFLARAIGELQIKMNSNSQSKSVVWESGKSYDSGDFALIGEDFYLCVKSTENSPLNSSDWKKVSNNSDSVIRYEDISSLPTENIKSFTFAILRQNEDNIPIMFDGNKWKRLVLSDLAIADIRVDD